MSPETRRLRNRIVWNAAFLIAVLSGAALQAQVTRTVMISIQGPCSRGLPNAIGVVLNGDESRQFDAVRTGPSTWIGEWDPDKTFRANQATASVRLGGARSECEQSVAVKDRQKEDEYVALFTFACEERPAQKVVVATVPDVAVSYVRTLPRDKKEQCVEHGHFRQTWTLDDVRFPHETLRLQLVRDKPDVYGSGLVVDDDVMQRAIQRNDTLGRDDVLTILRHQRSQQKAGSGSHLSPNADQVDKTRLEGAKFESLKLKVE